MERETAVVAGRPRMGACPWEAVAAVQAIGSKPFDRTGARDAKTGPPRASGGWAQAPDTAVSVSLDPLPDRRSLERRWRALEECADGSAFLSWSWIGCWLDLLPRDVTPWCLTARVAGRPAGLAILVERRQRRRGVIVSRVASLHESGERSLDELRIEHNDFLMRRDCAGSVRTAFLEYLARQLAAGRWDEVSLPGVSQRLAEQARQAWRRVVTRASGPSYFVDRSAVKAADGGYLGHLSARRRARIRRSLREFEKYGALSLRVARTKGEAQAVLAALVGAQIRHWRERGVSSAFEEPPFLAFHQRFVQRGFDEGKVVLVEIAFGERVLGYLYLLRHDDRLFGYQWAARSLGRERSFANQVNPLELMNYLLVEQDGSLDFRVLDFLEGDQRFKRSLATGRDERFWLLLQRDRWLFRLEERLRRLKRARRAQAAGAETGRMVEGG